jgi:hypothetical protein
LDDLILAPLHRLIDVGEHPERRVLLQVEPRTRELAPAMPAVQLREHKDDAAAGTKVPHLEQSRDSRAVHTFERAEVEDHVTARHPRAILRARGHIGENAVGGAEEDEAADLQDMDLVALLPQQLAQRLRTLDIAVELGAGQLLFDHADPAVANDEDDDRDHEPECHALHVAEAGDDQDDEHQHGIVDRRQPEIRVVEPFGQQPDTDEQQHATDQRCRQVRQEGRAGDQAKEARPPEITPIIRLDAPIRCPSRDPLKA